MGLFFLGQVLAASTWKNGKGSGGEERDDDEEEEREGQAAKIRREFLVGATQPRIGAVMQPQQETRGERKRYVELLVHNVSHTDLIFSLDDGENGSLHRETIGDDQQQYQEHEQCDTTGNNSKPNNIGEDEYCLCRPRFSCFVKYSRLVLEHLSGDQDRVLTFPRYRRRTQSPRLIIDQTAPGVATAVGFELRHAVPDVDLHEVRLRGRDQARIYNQQQHQHQGLDEGAMFSTVSLPQSCTTAYCIRHVFFPLLATLLPKWNERIRGKEYCRDGTTIKRVLLLVSGVGTPRNWTHDARGNSTEYCAQLMERFLARVDPDLVVVRIHSETNLFRYDENLVFVERELMPTILAYRDAHARGLPYPDELQKKQRDDAEVSLRTHPFSEDWRASFHTTLSFADGSPARTYAIQASLRPFKPAYFHFWQLKTFWHEAKLVDDDIEIHAFEAMETIPAVDTSSCTDGSIRMVVAEIQAFRDEMSRALSSDADNDIRRFWLRKSHKPVLAVLLVQSADMDKPVLYRGTNMEVSMPTGSLCAERNVIGSALADRPGLKREDLKLIAVLAVPFVERIERQQLMDTQQQLQQQTQTRTPINDIVISSRKSSFGSEASALEGSGLQDASTSPGFCLENNDADVNASFSTTIEPLSSNNIASLASTTSASNEPKRRISLKCPQSNGYNRTVVLQHTFGKRRDLNPLRPCGACNEWLKKIAESNPYFKILTFTDADCNGLYATPCQE